MLALCSAVAAGSPGTKRKLLVLVATALLLAAAAIADQLATYGRVAPISPLSPLLTSPANLLPTPIIRSTLRLVK